MIKTIRTIHLYLGLFFAPSIIFFALTGSLQVYHLHEGHGDKGVWGVIAQASSIHKDLRLMAKRTGGGAAFGPGGEGPDLRSAQPPAGGQHSVEVGHMEKRAPEGPEGREGEADDRQPPDGAQPNAAGKMAAAPRGQRQRPHSSAALQVFVVLMAIGLITTSLLGIYMAFKYNRDRRVIWGCLLMGIAFPVAFFFL